MDGQASAIGASGIARHDELSIVGQRDRIKPSSILQRIRDPVKPAIDFRHLVH
jgi:hypothetical protein